MIKSHQYQAMPAIVITGLCLAIDVPELAYELAAIEMVPCGVTDPPSSEAAEPSKFS